MRTYEKHGIYTARDNFFKALITEMKCIRCYFSGLAIIKLWHKFSAAAKHTACAWLEQFQLSSNNAARGSVQLQWALSKGCRRPMASWATT